MSNSFDPNSVSVPGSHFIDGRMVANSDGIDVRRPSDGAVYAALSLASKDLVDEAVQSAANALKTSDWRTCSPRERARRLRRWADLLEENALELARLEAVGSTRPISECLTRDIPFTAEGLRFFAEWCDKLGGDVAATRQEHFGFVVSEPYGVVAAIAPWNFPLMMSSWKVGPALAAGNAVVLKPSELTPFSVLLMAELACKAGIPPGIFNVVNGSGADAGTALVTHPLVAKVTFTGSTATGSRIMGAVAQTGIKPVTLELGGKSPQIVYADAPDMDKVAAAVANGFLGNSGQVCVAGSRLIVERSAVSPLLDRLKAIASTKKPGATWDGNTNFPPVISSQRLDEIGGIVDATVGGGAQVHCGGSALDGHEGGAFYAPTILGTADADSRAVKEEIFGPVLTIQTFDTETEAFALAGHDSYGLSAGVHTSDLNRALRAVRQLESGAVWINHYARTDDFILPTGGFKRSGIGKDLGRQAVEQNLRHKTVLISIDQLKGAA